MSWMQSLFGGQQAPATQAQQPAQQPAAETSQNTQQTQQVSQQVAQTTQQAQNPVNPLDFLMQMGQTSSSSQEPQAPSLTIPQDTLSKVAQSIDYSKAISPEALQKLQAGDLSVLPEILNSTLQQQYQTIMQHQSALTDKFVGDRLTFEQANSQKAMRGSIVDSSLKLQDMHPAAQSMFRQTAKQLAQQFPEATPQDIEGRTWELMESLGSQFNRTQKQAQQQQKASEVNWDEWGGFTG